MWTVEVTYYDGTVKEVKANGKLDAGMKRQHFLMDGRVKRADVFEGGEYIDPTEL